jgi:dinuclear metal center YbgI/SA1388 family protein
MTVEQLVDILDERIPKALSEPWDNDGTDVIPDKNATVTRALCALDCTSEAIEAAKKNGCNLIITHHPLIFKPLGAITADESVGKRVIECIRSGIAVVSFHTRLDIIEGGVNDVLASLIGVENTESFIPYGRIGDVDEQSFEDYAMLIATKLGLDLCKLGLVKASESVKRVALVSGSGKDEIGAAIAAGADTFVTGEVMHNHMIECKEMGLNLICGTHYATERIIVPVLADIVREYVKADVFEFVREHEYGI